MVRGLILQLQYRHVTATKHKPTLSNFLTSIIYYMLFVILFSVIYIYQILNMHQSKQHDALQESLLDGC